MGNERVEASDMEVLHSMWPDELMDAAEKQFNIETKAVRDMIEDVNIGEDPSVVDFKRLLELTSYSEKGSSQLAYLVKSWEYKQANAARLLNEELNILSIQRQEAELKKLEIIEAHRFEQEQHAGNKRPVSILEEVYDIWGVSPLRSNDGHAYDKNISIDAEFDTLSYWKQRSMQLEKLLEESIWREQKLMHKLQDVIDNLQTQISPVEELSQILKRADNYLHFILQTAPIVVGHQDKELRYRFIYNHFPKLGEKDIIGKTDTEIFSGLGVKESQDFKREVLERGLPAKREITFETELFGKKNFLIYVEPVFSKAGETIGINYLGMDITDQVIKREKMVKLCEEVAVRKAKEKELNKTIHITEETMRAKQMLATMSHEIRSPLTGVVSMAEILANTKLDKEQRQFLDVMISSGDLILQLINDILDLSKVESGVMKLEAAKFQPREVVKHVLQTAAASLQKQLIIEGNVANDVPVEVIGDVLRIRQILTNLISNAIKFTHEGKVGINLYCVSDQNPECSKGHHEVLGANGAIQKNETNFPRSQNFGERGFILCKEDKKENKKCNSTEMEPMAYEDNHQPYEKTVLLRCDVYDTGIGIPEKSLPSLFKKYMQVSADHARKYGGTGLGLAICKQLVELMGGHLTVTSQVNRGSTFTFLLPCKVATKLEFSDDSDGDSIVLHCESTNASSSDQLDGSFLFQPRSLPSGFPSGESSAQGSNLSNSLSTSSANRELSEVSGSYLRGSKPRKKALPEVVSLKSYVSKKLNANDVYQGIIHDNIDKTEISGRKEKGTQVNTCGCGLDDNQKIPQNVTFSQCSVGEYNLEGNASQSLRLSYSHQSLGRDLQGHTSQFTANETSESSGTNPRPKILLVEDNKINAMVAKSMLKQLGHNVDVVYNGLEAVGAVKQRHYDLILMDVCMPVMDGLQATKKIRSFEENGFRNDSVALNSPTDSPDATKGCRRTTIIAMTANAMAENAAECLASGMDSFVSKPVTFKKLKECLQQYIPY